MCFLSWDVLEMHEHMLQHHTLVEGFAYKIVPKTVCILQRRNVSLSIPVGKSNQRLLI